MNRAVRSRLLLVALAMGLFAAGAAADPQPASTSPAQQAAIRQGTHIFRRILYEILSEHDLTPLRHVEDLAVVPEKTLLIILGEGRVQERLPMALDEFVEQGGAVLLATDRQARLPQAFNRVITGHAVSLPEDEKRRGYRGLAECPLVQPVRGSAVPVFRGLDRVATNQPSLLQSRDAKRSSLPLLATFMPGCQVETADKPGRIALDQGFAAGGAWGNGADKGRILVLADHSVFSNDMLYQLDDENQNLAFAFQCLDWLSERDDGSRRNRVLFVEEGQIQTKFDVQSGDTPPPPAPPLSVILQILDQVLRGLEDENVFNQVLLNGLNQVPPRRQLQYFVVALTSALALYGLARLGQARRQTEPDAPSLKKALAAAAAPSGEQRRPGGTQSGHDRQEPHTLARAWFASALGPNLDRVELRKAQSRLPLFRVRIRGGWWQRWKLGRSVRRIWRLAQETGPGPWSERHLSRLRTDMGQLDAALACGRLRFEIPDSLTGRTQRRQADNAGPP